MQQGSYLRNDKARVFVKYTTEVTNDHEKGTQEEEVLMVRRPFKPTPTVLDIAETST